MKPTLKFSTLLLLLFVMGFVSSCKKDDDPEEENEEEVITTLRMTFSEQGASNTFTVTFQDPDGEGGNAPTVFEDINLAANTVYDVSIELLNESDPNDVEDITEEILEEDNEHLFCFTPSTGELSVQRTDTDGTFEVGLQSTWTTTNADNGTVNVTLKHQPDGVKDGTCSPGDTDIELDFTLNIN